MSCPVSRTYPLRQPRNHKPPVPRWQLQLPPTLDRVFTAYIGLQRHNNDPATLSASALASSSIQNWLTSPAPDSPLSTESFTVLDGDDIHGSDVWVCYWNSPDSFKNALSRLNLAKIHASLGPASAAIGLWTEHFSTAISRLETNYSGLDYLPGLARLPDTRAVEHTYSAYWGAARDRIPDSAHDRFERDGEDVTAPPARAPAGVGQHLVGRNYENLVHIRSGQYWEDCAPDEREAYESKLEPTLKTGLGYLWENPVETGTIGLRLLRNKPSAIPSSPSSSSVSSASDPDVPLKETCGAGFFRSLGDLERWAEKHPSHLAIYLGAIKHAKFWGPERKLRTWHEVSVLKEGECRFEYVNCVPVTGGVRFLGLEEK